MIELADGRELAEARKVLDGLGVSEHGHSGELTVAQRIEMLAQDHADFINTVNLNVPEPYRQPQLDLSMVRMRDRITELERERDEARQARDGLLEAVKAFLECRRGILSGLHERYERAEHLADTAIAKAEARAGIRH
jgi:hypothetical protein